MKLIDNQEECFNHIAGKNLTFDQMILALKDCGILIAPWKEDIEQIDFHEKNHETVNRAVDDIVMACWFPNKASIGRYVIEGENVVFKKTIENNRPHLHQIIQDTQPKEVYEQISEDDFSSAFLVNIRNVIRVLDLVSIP